MANFEFNENGCTFEPEKTTADEGELTSWAGDFEEFLGRINGRSGDLYDDFNGAKGEFSDLFAWKIQDEADYDQSKWEDASLNICYLIATTQQWADYVEKYKEDRKKFKEKWEKEENKHKSIIADLDNDANGDVPTSEGGQSPREKAVSDMRSDFQDLVDKAKKRWRDFEDESEEISDRLKEGATKENIRELQDGGYLTWAPFNITGNKDFNRAPSDLPEGGDPHEVNLWWENLDKDERKAVMQNYPDRIRDLDGVPSEVRDELNRKHLIVEVTSRLNDENLTLDEVLDDGKGSTELQELAKLQDRLGDPESKHDHYLLSLDPEKGDGGRAIVATGNPDTADNVGTLVPGTTTDWTSVNGQMNRADALTNEANKASKDAENATIAWIGYDAPGVGGATLPERAEGATDELSSFQDGLRATHQGRPSNNTVIGHSYGSTVVGHTARDQNNGYEPDGTASGIDADNLVFVGSPGVEADHVSDLNFTSDSVHASTAEKDGISAFTGMTHETDPTSDKFGASQFESDPGSAGWWQKPPLGPTHSEYFDLDTESLKNMGRIIAGQD